MSTSQHDEWGAGRYEDTARELEPAAESAVATLRLQPGARVLDVACGTGNAAWLAARAGARVTGLDSSPRLIEVAQERVPEGRFVLGDAVRLPFDDGAFEAAVSVFGVIFASDAEQAAAELARVVGAGGRVAITVWPPRGPVFAVASLMRQALARLRPAIVCASSRSAPCARRSEKVRRRVPTCWPRSAGAEPRAWAGGFR
jgi:ubiquinone/menaquinone biosynthesis C-methylase UbiE